MNKTSSTSAPALPSSWVASIFRTMQGHYGNRWINMWTTGQLLPDGTDAGLSNAMHHWGEKLGQFHETPNAIKGALRNLPTEPPTLPQFVELVKNYRGQSIYKLEHKLTPEERAASRERIREIMAKLRVNGNGQEAQH